MSETNTNSTRELLLEANRLISNAYNIIDAAVAQIDELEDRLWQYEPPDVIPNPEPEPPPLQEVSRIRSAMLDLEPDDPTGAWGKSNGGRAASESDVMYNIAHRLDNEYEENMRIVSDETGVPVPILLAIACRESNHGASLDSNGWGDNSNGFGVMQVDKRYHDIQGSDNPRSMEHIRQATGIFVDFLTQVMDNHPDWDDKYMLKGGVTAYNSGVSNVQTIEGMDVGSTGNDYGADTMCRAQKYYDEGKV